MPDMGHQYPPNLSVDTDNMMLVQWPLVGGLLYLIYSPEVRFWHRLTRVFWKKDHKTVVCVCVCV